MLFMTNHDARDDDLVVRKSMEINWRQWMNEHALGGRPAE